jgi:DNA-binding PadR family transcriptional regulator
LERERESPPFELVGVVLQSLIDDGLVTVKSRFELTNKGREYLEDPLRWRIDTETTEEVERRLFWDSIYKVFDKAYRRLRSKDQIGPANKPEHP